MLDKEQVANRILLMREKMRTPDDIIAESMNELLDFSPKYIAKYEEGIKYNQIQLRDQQKLIEDLEEANKSKEEKNNKLQDELIIVNKELDQANMKLNQWDEEHNKNKEELEQLRADKEKRKNQKKKLKKIGLFIFDIGWRAVLFFILVYIVVKILKNGIPEFNSALNFAIDGIAIGIFIFTECRNVHSKHYGKNSSMR